MREARDFDLAWEGRRCRVHELGAKDARAVAVRVANVAGRAVREGAAAGLEQDLMIAGAMAIGSMLEKLDVDTVEWLTATFQKQTQVEREPGSEEWVSASQIPDLLFGGSDGLTRWGRWLAFCLEMTCADFFGVVRQQLGKLPTKVSPKASPSPSTSPTPGTFTGSA